MLKIRYTEFMILYSWKDIQNSVSKEESPLELLAGSGITIGSFDGLHLGHRKIISALVEMCNKEKVLPGVVTFNRPLPLYKHSSDYAGDISTLEQRLSIMEELGIKFAIVLDFTDEVSKISGHDFLSILKNVCNLRCLCEGEDFRCGYKGATDMTAIKYWAEQNEVKTTFVAQVLYKQGQDDSERISSSYIRSMIQKGFFSTATELLTRPYVLSLKKCTQRSDKNLVILKSEITQVLPPAGIYHVKTEEGKSIRLEITENELIFDVQSNLDAVIF